MVFATARNPDALRNNARVMPVALDLSDYESVAQCAKVILDTGATLDLIIHNAGYNPKDSKDDEYFRSTFRLEHFSGRNVADSLHINALAPVELTAHLLPALAADGVVVNISSWLGSIGEKSMPGHYGYAGSKALLNMLTKGMALEFAESGRAVVALNPGWMATSMGGDNATSTPTDVAGRILSLYTRGVFHENNGRFLKSDGSEHLW